MKPAFIDPKDIDGRLSRSRATRRRHYSRELVRWRCLLRGFMRSMLRRKYRLDLRSRLRVMLFGSFLRTICYHVDEVTVVETVQFRCFIQESEISIRSYPWLRVTEVVLCLCQAGTLQIGDAVES